MTKKYLCGVVSAAVLMGACPTAVFAADLENPLDFRSMTEDAADTDAGWAWDASSQTLTVENLSLTVPQGKLEERVLKDVEGIGICELTDQDVVRHVMVQRIIKAYADYETARDEKRKK